MKPCQKCIKGPEGLPGHDALQADQRRDVATQAVVFKCHNCSALWGRGYEGSGLFRWVPLAPN